MKKHRINAIFTCLLLNAILFTSCNSPAPTVLTDGDKQFIQDMNTKAQNSWNEGDREPYVNRYSKDAIFLAPNMAALVGQDAIRTFAGSFPKIQVKFPTIEIMGSSEYAYVRGEYFLTNAADSLLDKGKFLSIWKMSPDSKWLITRDMFNSDLPVPVAKEEKK